LAAAECLFKGNFYGNRFNVLDTHNKYPFYAVKDRTINIFSDIEIQLLYIPLLA